LELNRNDNSYAIALDDSNFRINTRRDIRLTSGDDIYIDGRSNMRLRNYSRTSGITIETDATDNDYEWLFGEDGNLTTPGDITVAGDIAGSSSASTLVLKAEPSSNTYIQLNDTVDSTINTVANLEIRTDVANTAKIWTFGPDGSLTLPGDIRSENAINIDINLSDSTLRRWRFEEDGELSAPGTIKVTADGNGTLTSSSGYGQLSGDNGAELYFDNGAGITSSIGVEEDSAAIVVTDMTPGSSSQSSLAMSSAGNTTLASAAWINLITNNGPSAKTFRFDSDGALTFPNATVQTTAFTANPTVNVLKIDDGVHEKFQTKADATGVVTHDCALGHIIYHTSPDDYFTVNLTNLNLASGYATSITVVMVQAATGYGPNALQIGGVAQTINWQGGSLPAAPTANGVDVMTFSILNNSGTYTVLGQVTGFNEVA
jgi:hypothetical protein